MANQAGARSGAGGPLDSGVTDNSSVTVDNEWPDAASRARLHFVSGKGGTGKTTIAAALALALAADGKKVLLVETEGRQGIAQVFDIPPLPPADTRIATVSYTHLRAHET